MASVLKPALFIPGINPQPILPAGQGRFSPHGARPIGCYDLLSISGRAADSYSPPLAPVFEGFSAGPAGNRMLMAADIPGPNDAGAPPPPAGGGSGSAGSAETPWLYRPSFRTPSDVDRIYAARQMNSAAEFMESMIVDLATIEGAPAQLEYLDGLLTSVDEMVRSGNRLGYRAILDVVHGIALEADGLTDFIGVRSFEPSPGEEAAGSIMWRISFVTDFLERELFRSNAMDASAAEMATRIYMIAAVKGSCKQALEAMENFNPRSRIHMAHMAKGALVLTDVLERFERLGNEEAAREAKDALVAFMLHHDVPVLDTVQWSLTTAKNFIRFDLEYMRGDEGVDEELFIENLRFFSNGNRSFAPEIIRAVQLMLIEKGERDIWQMLDYELMEEDRISELLRKIRGPGRDSSG